MLKKQQLLILKQMTLIMLHKLVNQNCKMQLANTLTVALM